MNLGRDKVWADKPEIWAEIDKAVKEEVGRLRVLQKVFVATPTEGAEVQDPIVANGPPLQMAEGQTMPLVEIFSTFALTQTQVEQEAKLRTACQLARRAARYVAVDEDRLFLVNGGPNNAQRRNAGNVVPFNMLGQNLAQQATLFDGVVAAIAGLAGADQPGPYALFVGTQAYADAHRPLPNTLITEADRIRPLVESGFHVSSTLGQSDAIVVSLGGETVSMYVGTDATTAFTQWDGNGFAQFRVFERVRLVVREPAAIVRFQVVLQQQVQAPGPNPNQHAPAPAPPVPAQAQAPAPAEAQASPAPARSAHAAGARAQRAPGSLTE